MKCYWFKHSQ